MSLFRNGNWGLKLLALALAIVIYLVLKNESVHNRTDNDRSLFHPN